MGIVPAASSSWNRGRRTMLHRKSRARSPTAWWHSITIKQASFNLFYLETQWWKCNSTTAWFSQNWLLSNPGIKKKNNKKKKRKNRGYDYYSKNVLAVEAKFALQN